MIDKIELTFLAQIVKEMSRNEPIITCWHREISIGVIALESGVVPRYRIINTGFIIAGFALFSVEEDVDLKEAEEILEIKLRSLS